MDWMKASDMRGIDGNRITSAGLQLHLHQNHNNNIKIKNEDPRLTNGRQNYWFAFSSLVGLNSVWYFAHSNSNFKAS